MARAAAPAEIRAGVLHVNGAPLCAVGTPGWRAWLADPESRAFRFHGARGALSARRERQRNGWYWYAYRRAGGRLRKAYLGRDEDLSLARLESVAAALAAPRAGDSAPAQAARPSPANTAHLLTTKFHPPPTRPDQIPRPRLFARLADALIRPLTVVVAPAGFGKTTLLASTLANLERGAQHAGPQGAEAAPALRSTVHGLRSAWLSLDSGDNDPARFWSYLLAALEPLCPGVSVAAWPLVESRQPAPHLLSLLLNALAAAPADGVLVLDDYHLIETPAIHEALTFIVEQLPARLRLVLLSRAEPLLPLARLRVRGLLAEIRAADLRFTTDEAAQFLAHATGRELDLAAVQTLEARTEGWAAALQLASLALRDAPDPAAFIASFAGSHRAVADYLADEVIRGQPPEVQRFLLQTSVLDRMCAELCDTLLGQTFQPAGDRSSGAYHLVPANAQEMLDYLERANLFLVPLDDERRWYRYHHLFADMLRATLRRRHPELIPELHRLAAGWYADQNLTTEAVEHALASGDLELAALLIEQIAPATLWVFFEVHTLLGWLRAFPESLLRARPRLMLVRAWALLARLDLAAVEETLSAIEAALEEESPAEAPRALLGELAGIRSFVLRVNGDMYGALDMARRSLDLLPPSETDERAMVATNLWNVYLILGDVRAAEQVLAELPSADSSISPAMHALTAAMARSGLCEVRGRLKEAYEIATQALRAAEAHGGQGMAYTGMIYAGLAAILYKWNDLAAAERHARAAVERGERWWNNDILLNAYEILAAIQQARGDTEGAAELYRTCEQLALAYDIPWVHQQIAASRAHRAVARGDIAAAARWAEEAGLRLDGEIDGARIWEYAVLARIAIAQGRAAAVLPLLGRLLALAEQGEYVERLIDVLKLRALALRALGRHAEACQELLRAIELGEEGGYMRVFLDEGPPLAALLKMLYADRRALGLRASTLRYVQRLLAAFDAAPPGQTTSQPPAEALQQAAEPLTPRELTVLQLLGSGLSNQQIAAELVVAVSTVRSHVKSIYAKLGAHNRVQAVARARQLQLLPS